MFIISTLLFINLFTDNTFSNEWTKSINNNNPYRPTQILSAFWQMMQKAAAKVEADIILVDTAPNLGAINRSILIAMDYVLIHLGADLFSLQGLKNIGSTLRQ